MQIRTNITRPTKDMLDVQAAASRIGLHPQTLQNYRCRGTGPDYYKEAGRTGKIWYLPADLDAWVADRHSGDTAAGVERAISTLVESAPALTPAQCDVLARILKRGSRRGSQAGA